MHQVDQLLEYHFEEDMTRLTQHCGKKLTAGRQTIIVSATLKQDVRTAPRSLSCNVASCWCHFVLTGYAEQHCLSLQVLGWLSVWPECLYELVHQPILVLQFAYQV